MAEEPPIDGWSLGEAVNHFPDFHWQMAAASLAAHLLRRPDNAQIFRNQQLRIAPFDLSEDAREISRLRELLWGQLKIRLRHGDLVARGALEKSVTSQTLPAELFSSAAADFDNNTVTTRKLIYYDIKISEKAQKPGPKTSSQMMDTLNKLESIGRTFRLDKERHHAVLVELGLKDTPRGFGYDTFCRQLKARN